MKDIAAVIIRVLGLVAVAWVGFWAGNIGYDEAGGANIGAGLLAFLVVMIATLVWAVVDGRRSRRTVGPLVARWVVVAVVLGVLSAFQTQGFGTRSGLDTEVLRSDLTSLAPFTFGLVAVPAAVGLAVGALIARGRGRRPSRR